MSFLKQLDLPALLVGVLASRKTGGVKEEVALFALATDC